MHSTAILSDGTYRTVRSAARRGGINVHIGGRRVLVPHPHVSRGRWPGHKHPPVQRSLVVGGVGWRVSHGLGATTKVANSV